jgi:hypothetical protein
MRMTSRVFPPFLSCYNPPMLRWLHEFPLWACFALIVGTCLYIHPVAGRIAAITMIAQSRRPSANVERFYDSEFYAIYYNGDFPAYTPISKQEHPIYVGEADPADPALRDEAIEDRDFDPMRSRADFRQLAPAATGATPR